MSVQAVQYIDDIDIEPRLVKRFSLSALTSQVNPLLMSRVVSPVTSFDELLRDTEYAQVNKDISAGAGSFVAYHTVPKGKRWIIHRVFKDTTTANSRIAVSNDGGSTFFYCSAAGTVELQVDMNRLPMEEEWAIGLMTTGNGADNSRGLDIYYQEEDAFRP